MALRLLRRVRDVAQVRGEGRITLAMAERALTLLDVDEAGLDWNDRRVLEAIIDLFDGGPVGVETLAAAISEDVETVEDVYEPFLMQKGFLQRTPRGRVATPAAYRHRGPPLAKGGARGRGWGGGRSRGPSSHNRPLGSGYATVGGSDVPRVQRLGSDPESSSRVLLIVVGGSSSWPAGSRASAACRGTSWSAEAPSPSTCPWPPR